LLNPPRKNSWVRHCLWVRLRRYGSHNNVQPDQASAAEDAAVAVNQQYLTHKAGNVRRMQY